MFAPAKLNKSAAPKSCTATPLTPPPRRVKRSATLHHAITKTTTSEIGPFVVIDFSPHIALQ
jgi:hypothetical protein